MVNFEWTVNTLKEHLETLFDQSLASQKEAILKAETATEKRLAGLNEFRAALTDNQRILYPRSEAEVELQNIKARIVLLEQATLAKLSKNDGMSSGWAIAIGVIGLISLLISIFLMLKK